jgi:hypothetical protein
MFVPLALPPNPPPGYEAQAPILPSLWHQIDIRWEWEESRHVTRGPPANPPPRPHHTVVPKLAPASEAPPLSTARPDSHSVL